MHRHQVVGQLAEHADGDGAAAEVGPSAAAGGHRARGQQLGAPRVVDLVEEGARLAGAFARRLYNVAITNVPGPQMSLYAAGAPMVSTYPVMPLSPGQALSIGLTSYDGGVYYGLYADRDAFPDLDVLGHGLVDALQELLDAPRPRRRAR